MEEKEYVIVSSTEPEIIVLEEIVYESVVVAEAPNVIGNEQLYVYVPPLDSEYKNKVDSLVGEVEEIKDNIPSDTSELNNNGDGNSPFATEDYVEENGGKIDTISLNGEDQQIINKKVNLIVTADTIGAATKQDVDNIEKVIPNQASETNKLADKDFVNSSIETATAVFRGTYTDLDILKATTGDKNDYSFYEHNDVLGNRVFDRYKHNGTEWLYEYSLNNSSFTDAQWKAINSGATAELIKQISVNTSNINNLLSTIETELNILNTGEGV